MEYSADDITVPATDAIACRLRPGMYVGPVDSDTCVSTMLQEAMCLSLQSVLDGLANEIQITCHRDGSISVRDNGPNLDPSEIRDETPVVELLLTKFHACRDAWDIPRSASNFGIVSTVALSKSFVFESTFNGSLWRQEFRIGIPVSPITHIKKCADVFRRVTFTPDDNIIQNVTLSYSRFQEWFDEYCGMINGCQINYLDEQNETSFEVAKLAR
ncbi:hypothetical protein [Rhodopirellula baltica]